jgi:molecular chaperone DnaJ
MGKSYYQILGVTAKATDREIRRSYLRQARREHPDLNPGDSAAPARFREIKEAYRVLSRQASRAIYDREGKVPPPAEEEGRVPGHGRKNGESRGWENILRDIFQETPEIEPEAVSARGEDIHQVLEVSFEESLRGVRRECRVLKEGPCPECGGNRFAPGAKVETCPECVGSGLVEVRKGPWTAKKICPRCGGVGEVSDRPCPGCSGRGRRPVTETVAVDVAAGSDSGTRIVVSGAGQPGKRGGEAGDLVVTIKVRPHPVLERRGYNLHCSVPITVSEAALGATILVPTAEKKASIKIPMGTQSGQQFRLRGKGIAIPGRRGSGDLYITTVVVVPPATDPRARRLFRELEKIYPENPRVKGK